MANNIMRDIKNLKIQGATNVALKSLDVVSNFLKKNEKIKLFKFIKKLNELKDSLIVLRKTEPMQYNYMKFIMKNISNYDNTKNMIGEIQKRIKYLQSLTQLNKKKISLYSMNIIQNYDSIYTHCHSSTVINSLINAKKHDLIFHVNNNEARPRYQGRTTALDLIKNKIVVNHYVDSQMPVAIKESRVVMLGCDSLVAGYFYNKIGTEIVVRYARKYDLPVYIFTQALKFDPRSLSGIDTPIEKRDPREIWTHKSKYLNIINNAFDKVRLDDDIIIVSELGVFNPNIFFSEVQKAYPWILE